MSRNIQDKDIKILFSLAHNQCAFPGCGKALIYQEGEGDPVVLAMIAHIVGDSPNGPRGLSDLTNKQRDHYSNLILLCGDHHKLVDSRPDLYTVQLLHGMKSEHEVRVAQQVRQEVGSIGLAVTLAEPLEDGCGSQRLLHYRLSAPSRDMTIEPVSQYLTRLRSGGPIAAQTRLEDEPFFPVVFPTLDIKLVNNSRNTVFVTEVVIETEESVPDLSPILLFEDCLGDALHKHEILRLRLINDGWGLVEDCEVSFNIVGLDAARSASPDRYQFHRKAGTFAENVDIILTDELKSLGVDTDYLAGLRTFETVYDEHVRLREATQRALGPFHDQETARVDGEVRFAWRTPLGDTESSQVRFTSPVRLYLPDGLGGDVPASDRYDAVLPPNGPPQPIRVPVSQAMRAGEPDRFLLTLGSPRSSRHRFRLRMLYIGGELESNPIDLSLLVPRSSAALVFQNRQI